MHGDVPMIKARSSSSPVLRWLVIAFSRLVMKSFVACAVSSLTITYDLHKVLRSSKR